MQKYPEKVTLRTDLLSNAKNATSKKLLRNQGLMLTPFRALLHFASNPDSRVSRDRCGEWKNLDAR